ncbi:MAG: hypothetical protein COB13_000525 [OCS116 cluster bacterium]|nr:hypothetical protein [OCS116 cluster bacterium]
MSEEHNSKEEVGHLTANIYAITLAALLLPTVAREGIAGILYLKGEPSYAAILLGSAQEAFVIGW